MNDRRRARVLPPLAACAAALLSSCGPSDPVQTVSFVLDLDAQRVSRIEFTVTPEEGRFVGDDGSCVVGKAAAQSNPVPVAAPSDAASDPGDGVGVTTSSVTTSSVTTSTSSTTTTTLGFPLACRLVFHLVDDVTLGSIQWLTDYGSAPGFPAGSGASVECSSLVAGTLEAYFDDEVAENLDSGLISIDGFTGPTDLIECNFRAQTTPQASDFPIQVTDAAAPDVSPVLPLPDVTIRLIECEGAVDTTTTTAGPSSTTTTTVVGNDTCGDRVVDPGEECDDGNVVSGDGCSGNCDAEFAFTPTVTNGALTVEILNGRGIPPGASLAFCRFQGDISAANLKVSVGACGRPNGGTCNATTLSGVSVSTTTTTTSTTTTLESSASTTTTTVP